MKKKPKVNPNCSVSGCKAKAPHVNDPVVAGLVHNFSGLAKVAGWTCASIAELGKSMADDVAAGLITRTRQQEELYVRALYAMFIADSGEVAHIMSDATPNSFSVMYRKVNQLSLITFFLGLAYTARIIYHIRLTSATMPSEASEAGSYALAHAQQNNHDQDRRLSVAG